MALPESLEARAFLDLENALTLTLLRSHAPAGDPVLEDILEAVEDDRDGDALDRVNDITIQPAVEKHTRAIQTIGLAAILFGAQRALGRRGQTSFQAEGTRPEQLQQSADFMSDMVIGTFSTVVQERARNLINQLSLFRQIGDTTGGNLRPESTSPVFLPGAAPASPERLGQQFRAFMLQARDDAVTIASSLHVSRLASWGFVSEAERLGIEFYEVDEVLDRRTCPVCRQMDGKVFPVPEARLRLEFLFAQSEAGAQTMRNIAPWPRQDRESISRMRRMSDDELLRNGWAIPPYHPKCRGVVKRTTKTPRDIGAQAPIGGLNGLLQGIFG